ncbi:MAG: hypothetical protein JSS82_10875 [Bacteroidetes bacterium]|nr:hypothetical protein [Bacteroidota bacterium]
MKKAPFYVLALLVCLTSCKKKDTTTPTTTPTTQDMLTGTWLITKEAKDVNKNNTMDAAEVNLRNGDLKYIFESNGNATMIVYVNGNPSQWNYTWTLNDKDIRLIEKIYGDTSMFHIEEISITDLRLSYYSSGFTYWRIYQKQ